jgi:hypothetical protein
MVQERSTVVEASMAEAASTGVVVDTVAADTANRDGEPWSDPVL